MTGKGRVVGLVVLVLLGALVWIWVGKKSKTPVAAMVAAPQALNLLYDETVDDECQTEQTDCVDVLFTEIWKKWNDGRNAGKPKRVKWFVDNSQMHEYYFEIAWKGPAGANYLGPVDPIECTGQPFTRTSNDVPGGPGYLEWTYQVTVYECTDNNQQGDCLCKSDPRVGIRP